MNDFYAFLAGTIVIAMFLAWLTFLALLVGRFVESRWRHQRLMQADLLRWYETNGHTPVVDMPDLSGTPKQKQLKAPTPRLQPSRIRPGTCEGWKLSDAEARLPDRERRTLVLQRAIEHQDCCLADSRLTIIRDGDRQAV